MSRSVHFGRNIYNADECAIPFMEGEELHRIQTTLFSINDEEIVDYLEDFVNQQGDFQNGMEYDFGIEEDNDDLDYTFAGLLYLLYEKGYKKEREMLFESDIFHVYFEVW